MMEMTIRPMTPQERNYSYSQSQQLTMQTGCIGHLRADFGSNGLGFFSSWDDHRADLKSDAFKAEFDDVINGLREDDRYGGILKSRRDMTAYCYDHPASGFEGNYTKEYGFRVDTDHYSYMLRLNPNKPLCLQVLCTAGMFPVLTLRTTMIKVFLSVRKIVTVGMPDENEIITIGGVPDGEKI